MPPSPRWGKNKAAVRPKVVVTIEELRAQAEGLRAQAEGLSSNAPPPSISVQLGKLLLAMDSKGYQGMLKKWDTKNKGEFLKGEMRLNLRNAGLNVTSAESDQIFDTWDEDGSGSLELKELRSALAKIVTDATAFISRPDPMQQHIQTLLKRAHLAQEAAEAAAHADALEQSMAEHAQRLLSRADVRLGALLQKRMIKPGEVVVHWAKSKGEHAGELSKEDFRNAVLSLFAPRERKATKRIGAEEAASHRQEITTSASEIDIVFDE